MIRHVKQHEPNIMQKKSSDLGPSHILPGTNSDKNINLQEPPPHRGKTLSESSASAVQYLTPSTIILPSEPNRQRSSTEHLSSTPTTTGNVHHKKARK
jgi:hypothetical protein